MGTFDLLFIAVFLTSLVTLLTAAILAVQGRGGRSLRILRVYGTGIGCYLGAVMITSLIST